MSTIYIPRLIESAEQAEALPIGTVALLRVDGSHRQVLTKTTDRGPGPWDLDMHGYPNTAVIGWTALVPIEAEEETRIVSRWPDPWLDGELTMTRLVTPWLEEA